MRVIKKNGDIIDVPVPVARGLVADGRASPIPGEEWRFPSFVPVTQPETTMIEPREETQVVRPRARARKKRRGR